MVKGTQAALPISDVRVCKVQLNCGEATCHGCSGRIIVLTHYDNDFNIGKSVVCGYFQRSL